MYETNGGFKCIVTLSISATRLCPYNILSTTTSGTTTETTFQAGKYNLQGGGGGQHHYYGSLGRAGLLTLQAGNHVSEGRVKLKTVYCRYMDGDDGSGDNDGRGGGGSNESHKRKSEVEVK